MRNYSGLKKFGLAGALFLGLAGSAIGQEHEKIKNGFYQTPDKKRQCLVYDNGDQITCNDYSGGVEFDVQGHNRKAKFFGYGDPWKGQRFSIWPRKEWEALRRIASRHGEDPEQYVLEGSQKAKEIQERHDNLFGEVVRPENLVVFGKLPPIKKPPEQ